MLSFGTRNLGETGNAIFEVADAENRWQGSYPSIQFIVTHHKLYPAYEVFQNTLIELVEDVRGDGQIDIGVWEIFPEGVVDTG